MHFFVRLLLLICFDVSASAANPTSIRLGMSAPTSGNAAALGKDYRDGANLVIQQVNLQGGIGGRPIELVCLDDGYEPLRTVDNTKQLLADPKLFALFGYVGTPTVNAVLPLLRKVRVPFVAPFTGANLIRQPQDDFVYNFRASYADEIQRQMDYLIDQQHFTRIALFVQADEFGASVEQLIVEQLRSRTIQPLVIARYQRNSNDVNTAVAQLKKANPELVVSIGHYQAIATAIAAAQKLDFHPAYSLVSFTGISELQHQLKAPYTLYASMVMPLPSDTSTNPLVRDYMAAARKSGAHTPSDVGLEGFGSAQVVVAALKACAAALTQQCFLAQLQGQNLAGFDLKFNRKQHQASSHVYLLKITESTAVDVQ